MPGQQELLEHVDLQYAESATEGDLLLGADALVAKYHDMVLKVRAVDAGEVLIVDRSGQIEADDFGTDGAAKWVDVEGLWRDCG
jgi:hypothetical protein